MTFIRRQENVSNRYKLAQIPHFSIGVEVFQSSFQSPAVKRVRDWLVSVKAKDRLKPGERPYE